jgi:hypothetical protein
VSRSRNLRIVMMMKRTHSIRQKLGHASCAQLLIQLLTLDVRFAGQLHLSLIRKKEINDLFSFFTFIYLFYLYI